MKQVKILAIESSCDETATAIVQNDTEVLANVVATQIDVHKRYGGVVPEVASRIHVENISVVIQEALVQANLTMEDIDAIAVTKGPGLIGSLHVGIQAAKTLAWAFHKPLIPVHHIAGHIYANALVKKLEFPLLALVVSGGHTELVLMKDEWSFEVLGTTQDDAIGEAFDKVGRVLRLPYPGGVYIDRLASKGKPIYTLAKPKTEDAMNFSFSGLKSSVLQFVSRMERKQETFEPADLAASFQKTAIDILMEHTLLALQANHPKMFVVAGGVAANSGLRKQITEFVAPKFPDTVCVIPPLAYCTDNAAMIAVAGSVAYRHGVRADFSLTADAGYELES